MFDNDEQESLKNRFGRATYRVVYAYVCVCVFVVHMHHSRYGGAHRNEYTSHRHVLMVQIDNAPNSFSAIAYRSIRYCVQ